MPCNKHLRKNEKFSIKDTHEKCYTCANWEMILDCNCTGNCTIVGTGKTKWNHRCSAHLYSKQKIKDYDISEQNSDEKSKESVPA